MKIQITVEDDRLVDLRYVGLEQGIRYWAEYDGTTITRIPERGDPPDLPLTWKITAAAQAKGLAVRVDTFL